MARDEKSIKRSKFSAFSSGLKLSQREIGNKKVFIMRSRLDCGQYINCGLPFLSDVSESTIYVPFSLLFIIIVFFFFAFAGESSPIDFHRIRIS